jgi:hypothetical protein
LKRTLSISPEKVRVPSPLVVTELLQVLEMSTMRSTFPEEMWCKFRLL